jgi:hypothetical protein
MTYRGKVRNGVIVLDAPGKLPEGAEVDVSTSESTDSIPSLSERLKELVGSVGGLPPDMAEHHDHYIHGSPKSSK